MSAAKKSQQAPGLSIEHLPITAVVPNAYNPNKMDDRTFHAEVESILTFGFVDPITVRPDPDQEGQFQVIDGEHRWRALRTFQDEGLPPGAGEALRDLVEQALVPAIALDVPDTWAKRLTVILNETRGRADAELLGELLAQLEEEVGREELAKGLPYSPAALDELIAMANEEPDPPGGNEPPGDGQQSTEPSSYVVQYAIIFDNEDQQDKWFSFLKLLKGRYPDAETIGERLAAFSDDLVVSAAPDDREAPHG